MGALTLVIGCSNEPDAHRLALTADQESYDPRGPFLVTATLSTGNRPVVLIRQPHFNGEFTKRGEPTLYVASQPYAYCGMAAMALLFCPVLIPIAWLDVADLQHRFDVMEANTTRSFPLSYHVRASGKRAYVSLYDTGGFALSPGDYELKVELDNQPNPGILPPFFWKPYSHPLRATTLIHVADPESTTTAPDG